LSSEKVFFLVGTLFASPSTFHANPSQCAKINLCRIAFFPCARLLFWYTFRRYEERNEQNQRSNRVRILRSQRGHRTDG